MTIVPLKAVETERNEDALVEVKALLERIESGECIALAFIEVSRRMTVTDGFIGNLPGTYHLLNSGAARLAARLAAEE